MSVAWEDPGKEGKGQDGGDKVAHVMIKGDIWCTFVFIKAVVTL